MIYSNSNNSNIDSDNEHDISKQTNNNRRPTAAASSAHILCTIYIYREREMYISPSIHICIYTKLYYIILY